MKTNKTAIFAIFGIVALGLAFSMATLSATACGYTDCGGESVLMENNVDVTSNSTSNNTNNNNATNNTNVIVSNNSTSINYPSVSGSCSVNVARSQVGEVVTWQAQGSGGNGYFSYKWTGTDNLFSYYPTISKRYNTPGTKTARVEITSDAQTIVRTCTVIVEEEQDEQLAVSCVTSPSSVNIGETVRYTANATGGTSSYSYSWSGTNSLTGSTRVVSKSYTTAGAKSATVTVTSGNQTKTATCNSHVEEDESYPAVSGSCTVSVSHASINEVVTWQAQGSGGNGYFSYRWTGTDGLSSYYPTITKRYSSAGTKTGTVQITSNGETITRTCSVVVEEDEVNHLAVSCVANPTSVNIGEGVRYTATATGGSSTYAYSWSGTDNLSGSARTVSKSYSSEGTKNATVTVTSGNQTKSATCSTVVDEDEDNNDDLDGYCTGRPSNAEEDEKVTWTAYPDGGNGNYDYDWSGTDSLDGDDKSITKRYDDEGTKRATVRITSDGESITRTCDVDVDEEDDDHDNDDLEAYCKASPDDGEVGDRIKWTVYPDGGNNRYTYTWDGDESLRGSSKSITKTYRDGGRKEAEVRVKSDGDSVTVRCHANIDQDYVPPTNDDDGIYLSSIPATGISPTMKISLFVAGMFMWSAFLSYLYIARRNEKMKEAEMLAQIED